MSHSPGLRARTDPWFRNINDLPFVQRPVENFCECILSLVYFFFYSVTVVPVDPSASVMMSLGEIAFLNVEFAYLLMYVHKYSAMNPHTSQWAH